MSRARYWMIALGLTTFLVLPDARAETKDQPLPQTVSPVLERLEPPNKAYRVGEVIPYRIRVRWPDPTHTIRMSPPDLNLEHLELIGIGQETVSEAKRSEPTGGGGEQILTFRFVASKPGRAKVNRFSLRWLEQSGAFTTEIAIPPIEVTIAPSFAPWVRPVTAFGVLLAGIGFSTLILLIRNRTKRKKFNAPTESLEERMLEQLHGIHSRWESHAGHQEFLSALERVLQQYSSQKFDWNPSQGGYNALEGKAEEKWSKKEAQELKELLHTLEHERFSGSRAEHDRLTILYQAIHSFIERKKII